MSTDSISPLRQRMIESKICKFFPARSGELGNKGLADFGRLCSAMTRRTSSSQFAV